MKKENKIGCGGAFILLLLFSVLITYWYVFVAIGLIGFAVWYYYHRKQTEDKAAADAQAKKRPSPGRSRRPDSRIQAVAGRRRHHPRRI